MQKPFAPQPVRTLTLPRKDDIPSYSNPEPLSKYANLQTRSSGKGTKAQASNNRRTLRKIEEHAV